MSKHATIHIDTTHISVSTTGKYARFEHVLSALDSDSAQTREILNNLLTNVLPWVVSQPNISSYEIVDLHMLLDHVHHKV